MKAFMSTIDIKPFELLILIVVAGTSLFLLTSNYHAYAIFPSLALLALLLLANFPQVGFYVVVILMPLSAVRQLSETDPTLTVTKLLGFGLFIVLLMHLFVKKVTLEQLKSNLWPWFFLFLLIYLMSALMSEYPMTSLWAIERLLVSYIFFAITLALIDPQRLINTLPIVILIGVTISSILGILGTAFDIPIIIMKYADYTRALGGTMDPNSFASFVVLGFPLLVHYLLSTRRFRVRALSMLLIILYVMAIMSSYSRGGFLMFSIILMFLLLEYRHRFKTRTFGFVMIFLLLAIPSAVIFTPTSYVDRIESITDTTDTAMSRRLSYIGVGFDIFSKSPIIGTGPGTYRDYFARTDTALHYSKEVTTYEKLRRYAHNTYIEVLTGTGIVGFVVFLIILALTLNNFITAKKQLLQKGQEKLASLIGAYKVAYLSVVVYFFMLSNMYLKKLWLCIAISQIAIILAQQASQKKAKHINK